AEQWQELGEQTVQVVVAEQPSIQPEAALARHHALASHPRERAHRARVFAHLSEQRGKGARVVLNALFWRIGEGRELGHHAVTAPRRGRSHVRYDTRSHAPRGSPSTKTAKKLSGTCRRQCAGPHPTSPHRSSTGRHSLAGAAETEPAPPSVKNRPTASATTLT